MKRQPFYSRPLRLARNSYQRFLQSDRLIQAEQTPFEIIASCAIAKLRYYPAGAVNHSKKPVVIVPPLAVNMRIYDLFPERSLVASLRDAGHPVYLIDWGTPSRQQAHYRFSTYIQELMPQLLSQARLHSGQQQLSLHGWSLGALFCYCYAALGDPDVERLVLLGPPCDYHSPGPSSRQNPLISRQLQRLQKLTGLTPDSLPSQFWHIPGWLNSLAFKAISPQGTIQGYLALAQRLDDSDYVAQHATNASFIDDMVPYPGGIVQDLLRYMIRDNVLAQGKLPLPDCDAELGDVRCQVLIVVGDKDPVVTPKASGQLLRCLSGANCELLEVPGGHMSIVSGSQAPEHIWPQVESWLAA